MIKRAALAAAGLAVGIGLAAGVSQAAIGPVSQLTTAHVSTAEQAPKPKEALATATPAPRPEPTAATPQAPEEPPEEPTEVPVADEATGEAPVEPEAPVEEPVAAPEPEAPTEDTDAPAPAPEPVPAPAPEAPDSGSSATDQGFDQRMVALINAERQAAGVAPLQYQAGLRAGALAHSSWMDDNDFQHASDATMDADTAAAGCSGGWAENIYWASDTGTSPEAAMSAYMDSPGHRENILHPDLRHVATGTVMTDGGLFNTQRFSFDCA